MNRSRHTNNEVKGAISPSCLAVLTVFTKKSVRVVGAENRSNMGKCFSLRGVLIARSGCVGSRQSRRGSRTRLLSGIRVSRPLRGKHGDIGKTEVKTAPVGGDSE